MYVYPAKTGFNRVLPKIKIYANAKLSKKVKAMFVSQVKEIVWQYKLSWDTINLPPRDGYTEIQVFEIHLKEADLAPEVLRVIDRAIPYPIFYRLRHDGRVKRITAYKRPAVDGSNKWVLGTYFATDCLDAEAVEPSVLPVALDIKALYEQMLIAYVDLEPRVGESIEELVTRVESIRKYHREIQGLEAKLKKEKQFNRKVELNAQVRSIRAQLQVLQ